MEKKRPAQMLEPRMQWLIGALLVAIIAWAMIGVGYVIEKSIIMMIFAVLAFTLIFFFGRWLMTRPISTKLETTRWGGMDLGTKLIMAAVALLLLLTGLGGNFNMHMPGVGIILLFFFLYWLLMAKKK